jgi:tripartite-type tricarboxylate transporter receptor subunit TctC
MRYSRRTVLGMLASIGFSARGLSAFAQQGYPSRPIKVIAPWPPGSSVDLSARTVTNKLNEILKVNLIIENRGGADGSIGTELAARAAPDGYTLVWGNAATHGANKVIYPNLAYDPSADFTPISLIHKNVLSLAVATSLPVSSFAEFLTYAKAHPGKISYGTPGVGSPHHLAAELLGRRAGIQMVHVPYKGGGPAVTDVIGGHIEATMASLAAVVQFHRSSKIRILAVTDSERYGELPDIPTITETFPGLEVLGWSAVFGPAHMPADITARLNAAIAEALQSPEVKSTFNKAGLVPAWSTPEDLARRVNAEIGHWREAVASGIKIR